jgi:hypothetical protein
MTALNEMVASYIVIKQKYRITLLKDEMTDG